MVFNAAVPSAALLGTIGDSETLRALLSDDSTISILGQNGVSIDTCSPVDTAIDEALRQGNELTDDQIKYLHLQRRWSPTRIAESRGVRGRKQVRLGRVYTVLGLRQSVRQEGPVVEVSETAP